MKNEASEHITIIGAGLVGSLLAAGLAQKGIRVTVLESRPDIRKQKQSAGKSINLALANRGINALRYVNLFDQVKPLLTPMQGRMVHPLKASDSDPNNNSLDDISFAQPQFQPYGIRPTDVIYSVSRAQLNALLLDEAERFPHVDFHFEHRVTEADLAANQLTLQSGQQWSIDRVIGTDGANSVLRDAIERAANTANTAIESVQIDELDHAYKELNIPADDDGKHQLPANALHIWPRDDFMLIALPNLDGSFTLTLFLAQKGKYSFEALQDSSAIEHFFQSQFPDVYSKIEHLLESFQSNPTGKLATVRTPNWHLDDKVLLLGDAAHAIVPFHGQGMNCGFEDCLQMLQLIDQANQTKTHWRSVFEQTAQLRMPNANAIADMALENYIEMRSSVTKTSFLKQKAIAAQIQRWFPKRFIPRYAMVMFESIDYWQAQKLGEVHKALLAELEQRQDNGEELSQIVCEKALTQYGL